MSEMTASGSKYDDQTRHMAAIHYASLGVFSRVSEQTNIPDSTLRHWSKQDWWVEAVTELREENKEKRIAQYDEIMDAAKEQVMDRLPDASARDAMIIMATAQDKGRILQSLPNSYQGKGDSLEGLASQFRAFADSFKEKQVNVVATVDKSES